MEWRCPKVWLHRKNGGESMSDEGEANDLLWERARLLCVEGKKGEVFQIYQTLAEEDFPGSHVAAAAILEEQRNPEDAERIYLLLRSGVRAGDDEAVLMLGRCVLARAVVTSAISEKRALRMICAVSRCSPSRTTQGIACFVLGDFLLKSDGLFDDQCDAESCFARSSQLGCIPASLELAKINLREERKFKALFFAIHWTLMMGLSEFFPTMRKRLMTT